jgi:plastocyanin
MRRFALLGAATLLAGCGGNGNESRTTPTVTVPAGGQLRVLADEYRFDPARVVVKGAGRLKITLDNRGALAHNLELSRRGSVVGGTPTFQGGRAESGVVRLKPGRYRMLCTVGDHAELGMTGTLEVR